MSFTEVLAELAVNLRLDSSQFASGSTRAVSSAKKLESGIGRLPKGLGAVTTAIGGLAGSFAGGLLIGGVAELGSKLVELGKGAIEHAAALHAESQQLGVTTDDLQRYRFAAGQVGLEQEKMDLGLKRLSKSIGLADRGLGPGAKAFAVMGINVRDANGHLRTAGELMPDIAAAIAKIPDPAARAALEFQLFGRSGQDMAPLLNLGAQGVRNLTDAADKAGVVISPELIERAHKLEVGFTRLKTIIETKVEVGILDAVEKSSSAFDKAAARAGAFDKWLQQVQSDADKWDKSHNVPTKSQFLGQFATDPLAAFDKMLLTITGHADEIDRKLGIPPPRQFLDGLTQAIFSTDKASVDWRAHLFATLDSIPGKLQATWQSFDHWWTSVTESTHRMVVDVEGWLGSRLGAAFDAVKQKVKAVSDAFHSLYDKVVGHSYVPDMVQGIADEFSRLKDVMVNPAVSASDKVSAAFQGLANVAGQLFGHKAGGIFSAIASAVSAIAPLFGGGVNFGASNFTITGTGSGLSPGVVPFTPRALGGPVVPGRTYRVGENGPEYVSFGSAGYVHPNRAANDRGRPYFDLRGAVMTTDLLRQMNQIGEVSTGRGAIFGAAVAEDRGYRRARQQIP